MPGLTNNDHFMQAIAGNVDHNARTIDGKNTFHGMGIIFSVTPKVKTSNIIHRITNVSSEELIILAKIERNNLPVLSKPKLHFKIISDIFKNRDTQFDNVWAASWFLNPKEPLWNGYMQMVLIVLKQLNVGKAGEGEYDYPDLLKDFLGMLQSCYKNDTRIDEILQSDTFTYI